MQKKNSSIENKRYLKKQFILLIIIIIYFLSISFIFGRYVLKRVNTHIAASKEFYFYSDKLDVEEKVYTISWDGTGECVIPVNIYTKQNSLKVAPENIDYGITFDELSSNAFCELSKTKGTIYGKESTVEEQNKNNDNFTVKVIPNAPFSEGDEMSVRVNVETVGNFEKKLTAKFVITKNSGTVLEKVDDLEGRAYLNLSINNPENRQVIITFNPEKVLIDTTNEIFSDQNTSYTPEAGYINNVSSTMSNINIRFFKKDKSANYTTNYAEILTIEYK